MAKILRHAVVVLLVLTAVAAMGAAQEEINVVGSGVAGRAFEAVVTDAPFTYEFNGTQAGIGLFCGGGADIVLTSRPLSVAEDTACGAALRRRPHSSRQIQLYSRSQLRSLFQFSVGSK